MFKYTIAAYWNLKQCWFCNNSFSIDNLFITSYSQQSIFSLCKKKKKKSIKCRKVTLFLYSLEEYLTGIIVIS